MRSDFYKILLPPLRTQFNTSRAEMFKVVFLGDSSVGKTCLAKLFVDRRTLEQSTATIGFDYHTMEVRLEEGIRAKVRECVSNSHDKK